MSDNVTAVLLAFMVILGPIWLFVHYGTKLRGNRQLNASDAAAFEQLTQVAARMEQRMATLERILDAEVPNWRQTADLGARNGTI